MTIRKIIELIDLSKALIGNEQYAGRLQDYIVTIQNNNTNLVLLKDITEKAISDYEGLMALEVPQLLDQVLVGQEAPFTQTNLYQQLIDLRNQNYPDPASHYNILNNILTQLQSRVLQNVTELDKLRQTLHPFQSKDLSEFQDTNNAIFSIIFNNEASYSNLKILSVELKNWDRGLFIYQQIISDETPAAFEIVEIDQGSVEVLIKLLFDVADRLLDLFKTGLEVYTAYLAYKTLVHDTLLKAYRGNKKLIESEEDREKLLLENIRQAVKDELKKQAKKQKKQEALEKKIDEVTRLITEHIIKGNNVKLISAPPDNEETLKKEVEKEEFFIKSQSDYKKLDEDAKQKLLSEYTTPAEYNDADQE